MCLAIPMRVLRAGTGIARCVDRHGVVADIDLALVGPVVADTWLLAFQHTARELVDAERAAQIDRALGALEAALRGEPGALDAAFPDLVGREPTLPDGLR
ncbi:MAG: HypC/HybG/HupF family hydrogenase formation chaperone [Gammaproteobacteria bacterium]|nr:HypC/HybG/HupF family hydrogenase formation chaperone [Gammaproteobacteria bacterium]